MEIFNSNNKFQFRVNSNNKFQISFNSNNKFQFRVNSNNKDMILFNSSGKIRISNKDLILFKIKIGIKDSHLLIKIRFNSNQIRISFNNKLIL